METDEIIDDTTEENEVCLMELLPNEILTIILESLDFKQMKSASLVSRRWNEVISESKKFLEKAKVSVRLDGSFTLPISRKYKSLSIYCSEEHHLTKNLLQQLMQFGEFIKSRTIYQASVVLSDFIEFINSCSSLESLGIIDITEKPAALLKKTGSDHQPDNRQNIIESSVIKHLKILDCCRSPWILDHLNCANIEKLEISLITSSDEKKFDAAQHIVFFLNKLQSLSTLSLNGVGLERPAELVPKFKWKVLLIDGIDIHDYRSTDKESVLNWREFFRAADCDAEINIGYPSDGFFLPAFFKEINFGIKITALRISLDAVDLLTYGGPGLIPLTGIKSLCVYGLRRYVDDDCVAKFSYLVPSCENLTLCNSSAGHLQSRYNYNFSNVKHLVIDDLTQKTSKFKLPSLETAEIYNLDYSKKSLLAHLGTISSLWSVKLQFVFDKTFKPETLFSELREILPMTREIKVIDYDTNEIHTVPFDV